MPSAKRQELLHRVQCAFVGSDGWVFVPGAGYTVRWSQECDTPEWAANDHRYWGSPTYTRHVFVTLVGGAQNYRVLLRVCRCPWVGATDATVTLARALEVLADPEAAFT